MISGWGGPNEAPHSIHISAAGVEVETSLRREPSEELFVHAVILDTFVNATSQVTLTFPLTLTVERSEETIPLDGRDRIFTTYTCGKAVSATARAGELHLHLSCETGQLERGFAIRSLSQAELERLVWASARPVAVPEDLDDPSLPKAKGRIELPLHISSSGPAITYDLDDRADRARVYEQVLSEGTKADVRYYVDAHELRQLWDELVLPLPVRRAWTAWLRRHPGDR
jgi:hypothetical protein